MNSEALPRSVRMLAAILLVTMWFRGYANAVPPGVPLIVVPDFLLDEDIMRPVLKWMVYSGMFLFATTLSPRIGCLIAGASLCTQTLLSMENFSNGRIFAGLLLVLIGLYRTPNGMLFLRTQVLLLYLGACLSKVIDPDWWNGRAMHAVLDFHPSSAWLANEVWLTTLGGWMTILTEGAILALLLFRPTRWIGCLVCLIFHTSMAVVLTEDFSIFFYAVAGSTLLFLEFPAMERAQLPSWLAWSIPYGLFENPSVEVAPAKNALLEFPDRSFSAGKAIWIALAFSPLGLLVPIALAHQLAMSGALVARSVALAGFTVYLGGALLLAIAPRRHAADVAMSAP